MSFQEKSGNYIVKIDLPQREVCMFNDFVAGKPYAFEAIFDHFHRPLYLHVLRFVKSPDLARDIVQDSFVKLFEKRNSIKPNHSLKAFLYTIAKNHLINILRRASCEARIKNEIIAHAKSSSSEQEDEIIYNDFEQFAEKAIEFLPPQRKLVFKMFKDEGKDCHQIASALGISSNTVRDHLSKASKFVRGYLKIHTGIISNLLAFFLFD